VGCLANSKYALVEGVFIVSPHLKKRAESLDLVSYAFREDNAVFCYVNKKDKHLHTVNIGVDGWMRCTCSFWGFRGKNYSLICSDVWRAFCLLIDDGHEDFIRTVLDAYLTKQLDIEGG
jgi:hypothetical protein